MRAAWWGQRLQMQTFKTLPLYPTDIGEHIVLNISECLQYMFHLSQWPTWQKHEGGTWTIIQTSVSLEHLWIDFIQPPTCYRFSKYALFLLIFRKMKLFQRTMALTEAKIWLDFVSGWVVPTYISSDRDCHFTEIF